MKYTVIFWPGDKRITIEEGSTLLEAAQKAGVHINNVCGGVGSCGKCKVIVKKGRVQARPNPLFTNDEIKKGYVLACQARVLGDIELEIPEESLLGDIQILTATKLKKDLFKYGKIEEETIVAGHLKGPLLHEPLAKKVYLKLLHPTLQDNLSDLERLLREIKSRQNISCLEISLPITRMLASIVRKNNWEVTVTLAKRENFYEIIQIEPGDTSCHNYALAIDVGTTTVVAQLIDLVRGEIIDTVGDYNRQAAFGEDVISRIIYACEHNGLDALHKVVVKNVNDLIRELARRKNVNQLNITSLVCSGNTTMAHLLFKLEPCYIRRDPYIPTATFYPNVAAKELGVNINPEAPIYCMPGVSSYVGGDITAGVLSCGMNEKEEISMLIDIGTNGEIALGNKEWLVCCSASAGPAFEGGGIKFGIRATKGAIQRVKITSGYSVEYSIVGDLQPKGICGSGLIDCLSEMLRAGIINKSGKIQENAKNPRLRKTNEGMEFILVYKNETGIDSDITISESDIANLIRSKAAVYAGASMLMRHMGLTFDNIDKLYVAGGFGNFLDIKKSIFIGLLPDLPLDKFEFIGNSSLSGARQSLLSAGDFLNAKAIAQKMAYIELSVEPSFMDEYVGALFLPHTHSELFPSVMGSLARNI
jgi:uncharacterized 2Fe-2S/4Fe-4S cluster protein (DUF4445 family)